MQKWKSLLQLGILTIAFFICAILLSACNTCCPPTRVYTTHETWLCKLNLDSRLWLRCADYWFLTGRPNQIERGDMYASAERAVSLSTINVGNFDKIVANGSFQIQIVGSQSRNSVYILGPHECARQVSVRVRNGTLYLMQTPTNPPTVLDKTIIRIGVRTLHAIKNCGCGSIYGRGLCSSDLTICSYGRGHIMLMGNMRARTIKQYGRGRIILIGVNTPHLSVVVANHGKVKVVGDRVGIKNIFNTGMGTVNIIGACSNHLDIKTSGCSLTTVIGRVNLKNVCASNTSRVYLYWVNSRKTLVIAKDQARVHLAGVVNHLYVNLANTALFQGQYLQSGEAYIQTYNLSHANVTTHQQLFADARNRSTIYYFGKPDRFTDFTTGTGMVISVPTLPCNCALPPFYFKKIEFQGVA